MALTLPVGLAGCASDFWQGTLAHSLLKWQECEQAGGEPKTKGDTLHYTQKYGAQQVHAMERFLTSGTLQPEDIRILASSELGKELLMGSTWDGALALKDAAARRIFEAYVSR